MDPALWAAFESAGETVVLVFQVAAGCLPLSSCR
jgi:hypothetical protein